MGVCWPAKWAWTEHAVMSTCCSASLPFPIIVSPTDVALQVLVGLVNVLTGSRVGSGMVVARLVRGTALAGPSERHGPVQCHDTCGQPHPSRPSMLRHARGAGPHACS